MNKGLGLVLKQGPAWHDRDAGQFGSADGWPPRFEVDPSAKLRALLKIFLRRRRLIFAVLILLNAVSFAAVHTVKPRYTAESALIIGSRQAQVLDLKDVLVGLSGDSEAIESEMQLLRSRKVARQVVQQLRLDENPEFNPLLAQPGVVTRVAERLTQLSERYLPAQMRIPSRAGMPTAANRDPLSLTADTILRHLTVSPKGRSRVVAVSFDCGDPALAASVANEVVNTYIANQLSAKREATDSAHRWLEDRVAEMREQVINADHAVAAYRQQRGITLGRTGNLLSEQISTLGEQVVQARTATAAAKARLQGFRNGSAAQPDTLPEAQSSATLQALQAQESTLLALAAELSRSYGESYPRVSAVRAAAASVTARIQAEIGKIAAGLQEDVRSAQARDAMLTSYLTSLRQDVDNGTESEVELHALEHEAEANRVLYDRLLARSRETNVEGGLQQADAQVVSIADTPDAPSFPSPMVILPIFFLTSCIVTVLLVFVLETLDGGFSSLEQVEQILGVAALGIVPRLRRGIWRRGQLHDQPAEVRSVFNEAVRTLHTGLMLSGKERPPKVILVTSALPGEGKSSVVLSLARLMASCNKRVVVVDCDLRHAALHKEFGGSMGPGLVECLMGQNLACDVLQTDISSSASLIAAGNPGSNSPDLFASEEMRRLLAWLSERFDLVILDSSPILAVSETQHLCRLADKTMIVARWQSTRRFATTAAVRQVLAAGGSMAGVLLSMVDLKQFARHSSIGLYQHRIGLYLKE